MTSALGDKQITHWTPQQPCADYPELKSAHSWVFSPPITARSPEKVLWLQLPPFAVLPVSPLPKAKLPH